MLGLIASTDLSTRVDVRLREAGRSYATKRNSLGLTMEQPTNSPWIKDAVNYVVSRQNVDGGYTFCRGTDSNAQDTYLGLSILQLLGSPFPNVKETVKWLSEFPCYSLQSHYYIVKSMKMFGCDLNVDLAEFLSHGSRMLYDANNVYVAVASEFQTAFMIAELVNMLGVDIDREKMARWLLAYRNVDGGFGVRVQSNLNSTYHAVASLFNLSYPISSLKKTASYVKSCETPLGGFTIVPNSSPPHMEHVYYGVSTLDLLVEHARYPERIARFVLMCQQSNGGFARSEFGISTFEDTFYAVNVLGKIGRL